MNRKRITLSEAQRNDLRAAYSECRDGATKVRFQAVLLYANGRRVEDIKEITGCSTTSLLEWWRHYRAQGIAGLVDKRFGGNSAKLSAKQVQDLQKHLHQYTPAQLLGEETSQDSPQFWTPETLAVLVQRRYGVVYQSATSYRTLLKKCGLTRQRPATQYKSRSEARVLDFEEMLEKN